MLDRIWNVTASLIRRRQRALFDAWVRDPLVQVQVEHPEALGRLVFLDDFDEDVQTGKAGRSSLKNVASCRNPATRTKMPACG